jgi:hypothetical protein
VAAVFLTAILIAGCATPQIDWDSRVGGYTYDQAVLEMGPPDKLEQLSDGTKVAEWLTGRGYSRGSFVGPGFYSGGPWIHHYAEPSTPDRYIRLIFDPSGRLTSWKAVLK